MSSNKPNRWAHLARALRFGLALLLMLAALSAPASDALAKKKKSSAPRAPSIAAAIVVDMNAGSILHAQAADTPRYPASLTKIMTLYVLFGYLKAGKLSFNTDLMVTQHAASQAPTKLGLKPGATIRTSDAIKALVTHSANDAAAVIAENIAGTEENFGRLMTQTARNMGMKNTTFRNASGLPNPDQVTTARDMAILAVRIIRDYPEYYGVFETRAFSFRAEATGTTTSCFTATRVPTASRRATRERAASTSRPLSSATTNISSPWCSAARPATSVMPPCGPCWTRTCPRPRRPGRSRNPLSPR